MKLKILTETISARQEKFTCYCNFFVGSYWSFCVCPVLPANCCSIYFAFLKCEILTWKNIIQDVISPAECGRKQVVIRAAPLPGLPLSQEWTQPNSSLGMELGPKEGEHCAQAPRAEKISQEKGWQLLVALCKCWHWCPAQEGFSHRFRALWAISSSTDFFILLSQIISALHPPTATARAAEQNPFMRPFALEFQPFHNLGKSWIWDFWFRPILHQQLTGERLQ